jgi:hypothetical protein
LDGDEKGRLVLVAFTLVQGPVGPELYVAVRNDGQAPSCSAGMLTNFYDKAGQLVTTVGAGLQAQQLYRFDPNVVLTCVDPGQIAMAAATDLPEDLVIGNIGSLMHSFPTFNVAGIVPLGGALTVSAVKTVTTGTGTAFTGKVTNGLDVAVSSPSVSIFPVNRVGRPLGVATSAGTTDVAPRGSWTFETSAVKDLGTSFAAYPAASIPNQ